MVKDDPGKKKKSSGREMEPEQRKAKFGSGSSGKKKYEAAKHTARSYSADAYAKNVQPAFALKKTAQQVFRKATSGTPNSAHTAQALEEIEAIVEEINSLPTTNSKVYECLTVCKGYMTALKSSVAVSSEDDDAVDKSPPPKKKQMTAAASSSSSAGSSSSSVASPRQLLRTAVRRSVSADAVPEAENLVVTCHLPDDPEPLTCDFPVTPRSRFKDVLSRASNFSKAPQAKWKLFRGDRLILVSAEDVVSTYGPCADLRMDIAFINDTTDPPEMQPSKAGIISVVCITCPGCRLFGWCDTTCVPTNGICSSCQKK
eukprot:NODE_2300_length_1154_cov_7.172851_g1908_i0.p1 GENE.NODE_2300_length_1154_cov_7.172851_g1908_i0~~NODE_2300_length_1154_cov_7.172851_g1908_i0.p1  ORF type:complete len:315 (+),score=47.77 NODE_2300_length_1154_cov_7.172851_g1908_i0:161-1105(+)